jgi:molecular chaperone GrpE (heat shock protein)
VSRADRRRLEQIGTLLEELVDDNTARVAELRQLQHESRVLTDDVERLASSVAALRTDLTGALEFRALKDLCTELIGPLAAIDAMAEQTARSEVTDPAVVASHLRSVSATLRSVLGRMGAEQVPIVPGVDRYDPARHMCIGLVAAADSPFPNAPTNTVVRVVEPGYVLYNRPLAPARVEIQADAPSPGTP